MSSDIKKVMKILCVRLKCLESYNQVVEFYLAGLSFNDIDFYHWSVEGMKTENQIQEVEYIIKRLEKEFSCEEH